MAEEAELTGSPRVISRSDRIYVTTERSLAKAIAANWAKRFPGMGRGWVYRVDLAQYPLELDLDLPRGPYISFQTQDAVVAAIADKEIDPDDPRHRRTLERFIASLG